MNFSLLRAWPILIALVGGALLGEAAWWGGVQTRASDAPPGMHKRDMQLPHHLAALTGDLPPRADAWSMSFHRTLFPGPGAGMHNPTSVQGTARLPDSGRLEVYTAAVEGAQGIEGVGLVLDRLAPASSSVIQASGASRRTLKCSSALPAPGGGPVAFSIQAVGGGVAVAVDGVQAQCQAQLPPAGPMLRSGLRRVQVSDLTLGGRALPAPGPNNRAVWQGLGAGALGLLGLGLVALGWRGRTIAVCMAPTLLAGWLTGEELHAWAETARVLWLPVPWLALWVPFALCTALIAGVALCQLLREGAPDWRFRTVVLFGSGLVIATFIAPGRQPWFISGALGLLGMLGGGFALTVLTRLLRSTSPLRTAAIASAWGGTLALGVALTNPVGLSALFYAYAMGACVVALIWVNINPHVPRAYNLTAFVLALAVVGCLEVVVRFTTAGQSWAGVRAGPMTMDIYSEVQTAEQEFSLFDAEEPSDYPAAGYPVQAPPPTGATRVITAGSSSTGGAYQNDNLSEFYPARMQELLGSNYQVINQGVGGWTTFHIDRFISDRIETLKPDILTLYVGHNDQLTALPRPISEIYERLHSQGPASTWAARLGQFRLYQGLRYSVASLRPAQSRVAVPLDHARSNLTHLIELMQDRGKVVLASEGLSPDPGPLQPYFQMMSALADSHDHVTYVDTAATLHQQPPAGVFLDDSHLTERGHKLVAAMLSNAILEESSQ